MGVFGPSSATPFQISATPFRPEWLFLHNPHPIWETQENKKYLSVFEKCFHLEVSGVTMFFGEELTQESSVKISEFFWQKSGIISGSVTNPALIDEP
jgi:hypothetical protein